MPIRFQRIGVGVWSLVAIVALIMGYPLAALVALGVVAMNGLIWWLEVRQRNAHPDR